MESKRLKHEKAGNEGKSDQNERAYTEDFLWWNLNKKTSHWLRLITLSGYLITVSSKWL